MQHNATQHNTQARDDVLSQFHLSFSGASSGGADEDSGSQHPSDVVVTGFTIAAPGAKSLLTDATLKLFAGRRYGLVGNNGTGKSTLLRFLAEQPCRLPVPANLDVLLVEQETAASDVPVVEQVLAADTVRTELLAEERALWAAIGGGGGEGGEGADGGDNDEKWVPSGAKQFSDEEWASALERLSEIGKRLVAIGADAAEPTVRSNATICKQRLCSTLFYRVILCVLLASPVVDVRVAPLQLVNRDVVVNSALCGAQSLRKCEQNTCCQ
jgi:hypothetical protein